MELKGSGVINPPFDVKKFDSELGHYIIGYVLGDGCIRINEEKSIRHTRIFTIDYDTVENFKKFFGKWCYIYDTNDRCENCKDGWTIIITGKETAHYFISIGITPRKANTCELKIPYTWNILRGYFDADGTVRKPPRKECSIASNSMKSLQQLIDFTKVGKIADNDWVVRGADNLLYVFDNMYPNPHVPKMKRKYETFKEVVKMLRK